MAVLLREAKGNAAPVGEHGSPSGMLRPGWVEATGWQAMAPLRDVVRHEKKARGLSIGALLGAWHDAACAAHVGAGEACTSAASSTPAPTRWREPLTGRMERPDQAGPSARRRVTTATPARLDFSAAEAAVKALQARCPQVARSVLNGDAAETRVPTRASIGAMRKRTPLRWVCRGDIGLAPLGPTSSVTSTTRSPCRMPRPSDIGHRSGCSPGAALRRLSRRYRLKGVANSASPPTANAPQSAAASR